MADATGPVIIFIIVLVISLFIVGYIYYERVVRNPLQNTALIPASTVSPPAGSKPLSQSSNGAGTK